MKKMIPILDAGHGGIINGIYQTPGKRSTDMGMGIIYEGAVNRWITYQVMQFCVRYNIPYFYVSPGDRDIPLDDRYNKANEIFKEVKTAYLISNHNNAGGGRGSEIFTSKGETKSDPIATIHFRDIEECMPQQIMRADYSDGDPDKEASYAVLTRTNCPAILVEWEFMDHIEGYKKLHDSRFLTTCAQTQFESINKLYHGVTA